MPALQTYKVISSTPVVVEDSDGSSISYPPGAVFSANPALPSILRLLSINAIVPYNAPAPGPGGGPFGPVGPPGPPGAVGINWRGGWDILVNYFANDAVDYNGTSYIAVVQSLGVAPPAPQWNVLAEGGVGGPGPVGPPGGAGAPGPTGPAGPIGINWRGSWSSLSTYQIHDGVQLNGSSYIALAGNTNSQPPSVNWDLVAQIGAVGPTGSIGPAGATGATGARGINWRGGWSSFITYNPYDGVQFNGSSFIALTISTNSPPPSAAWDLIAQLGAIGPTGPSGPTGPMGPLGVVWRGGWGTAINYAVGDAVFFQGSSYRANTAHTSNGGNQPPSSVWDIFSQIGNTGPTGPPGPAGGAGTPGTTWRGPWNNVTPYFVNDLVIELGSTYIALAPNTNSVPPSANWDLFAQGINNRGVWDSSSTYHNGDLVTITTFANIGNVDGAYLCVLQNTNVTPPNPTYWLLLAQRGLQGIQGYQGVQGPSGGVTGAQGLQGNQGNVGVTGATSNAGYRQQQVTANNVQGQQTFTISTASTPIATDRVYLVINTLEYRQPLHITVSIVVGVSFNVTWLDAFDLTSVDDILVVWFTTPP